MCFDGVERLCHIRGKLRKKVWIAQSDIVLVGLRDYQDAKADVILKYSPDEARNLKSYGEFPESVKINETVTFGDEQMDDGIDFEEMTSKSKRDVISNFYPPFSSTENYHHVTSLGNGTYRVDIATTGIFVALAIRYGRVILRTLKRHKF